MRLRAHGPISSPREKNFQKNKKNKKRSLFQKTMVFHYVLKGNGPKIIDFALKPNGKLKFFQNPWFFFVFFFLC